MTRGGCTMPSSVMTFDSASKLVFIFLFSRTWAPLTPALVASSCQIDECHLRDFYWVFWTDGWRLDKDAEYCVGATRSCIQLCRRSMPFLVAFREPSQYFFGIFADLWTRLAHHCAGIWCLFSQQIEKPFVVQFDESDMNQERETIVTLGDLLKVTAFLNKFSSFTCHWMCYRSRKRFRWCHRELFPQLACEERRKSLWLIYFRWKLYLQARKKRQINIITLQ